MPHPLRLPLLSLAVFSSLILSTLISTAEDWPKYRHDLSNSGTSGETTISSSNVHALTLKWKFNTGSPISASPAVATVNGTSMAFVGSWNGYFHALNAVSGQQIWSFKVDSTPYCSACMIASSAAVENGVVYFGADNAFLYALNAATGALVWKTQLGDPTKGYSIWSSPAVYNGVVYVGLASHGDNPCVVGHVVAVNATSGQVTWNFQTLDESTCPGGSGCVGAGVWASPAIASPLLFVGTGNPGSTCSPSTPNASHYPDSILALNLSTGALSSYYQAIANDNSDLDFGSSPALGVEGAAYSGHLPTCAVVDASKNGTVYEVNCTGTTLLNSYGIDGSEVIASPALVQHHACSGRSCGWWFYVYATTTGGHLNGTGPTAFNVSIPSSYSAPAAIQDIVLFGADDNALHAASNSGAMLWSFATGGAIYSGPAISNGRVYFGSQDGYLYCVSLNAQ